MFAAPVVACLVLLAASMPAEAQVPPLVPVATTYPGRVAWVAGKADRLAVVTEDGAVLISDDRGATWRRVLLSARGVDGGDDAAVLRVEGLLEDLADAEPDAAEVPGEEEEDVEEGPVPDGEGAPSGDELQDALLREFREIGSGSATSARVALGLGDRIAVSRADGVVASDDAGRTWGRLTRTPAIAMADTREGWVLALDDGRVWIDGRADRVMIGPLPLDVRDLSAADGVLWAATDVGLWSRSDASWQPVGELGDPLDHVVADPGWEGGLWFAGAAGIGRTDDGGATWQVAADGPPGPIVDLVWGGPGAGGRVVAVTQGGLWTLAGSAWSFTALPGAVTAAGDASGTFAVGPGGLLGPAPADALLAASAPPAWIPLGQLLHSTVSRPELVDRVGAGQVAQTLLPEVTVEGRLRTAGGLDYRPYTTASTGLDRSLMVRLVWTPAGRSTDTLETADRALAEVALQSDYDDLAIGGDRALLAAQGGKVGRGSAEYRNKLSRWVIDLYSARQSLFLERDAVPPRTLLEEVAWELRRLEIEARLDALAGGVVSDWKSNP